MNPASGRSGPVVELIPMSRSLRYRVTSKEGVNIQESVELSSPIVREVPCGEFIDVVEKRWSDHPAHSCVRRYKLCDGTGWVSSHSALGTEILECIGPSSLQGIE